MRSQLNDVHKKLVVLETPAPINKIMLECRKPKKVVHYCFKLSFFDLQQLSLINSKHKQDVIEIRLKSRRPQRATPKKSVSYIHNCYKPT